MQRQHLGRNMGVVFSLALLVAMVGIASTRQAAPRENVRTAYVDLNRLMKLHPAWEQLSLLRGSVAALDVPRWHIPIDAKSYPAPINPPNESLDNPRTIIQTRVLDRAETELADIERILMENLKQQVDRRQDELDNKLMHQMSLLRKDMVQPFTEPLKPSDEWILGRVNDQLRIIALRGRSEVPGEDRDGLLARADQIEREHEQSRISTPARTGAGSSEDEIAQLELREKEEIRSEVERFRAERLKQIAMQMLKYRNALRKAIEGSSIEYGDSSEHRHRSGTRTSGVSLAAGGYLIASKEPPVDGYMPRTAQALLARRQRRISEKIREETLYLVRRAAEREKLHLVFHRLPGSIDYTDHFATLISDPSKLGAALDAEYNTVPMQRAAEKRKAGPPS